jgi:hypothetical protein
MSIIFCNFVPVKKVGNALTINTYHVKQTGIKAQTAYGRKTRSKEPAARGL